MNFFCHFLQKTGSSTFIINDEKSSKTVTVVLQVDPIVFGDLVGDVSQKGNVKGTQSTFLSWDICPCQLCEMRVDGTGDNLSIECSEREKKIVKLKQI